MLNPALALHPALVALDLGDCMLGDEAINLICGLLPPDGAKSGEQEALPRARAGVVLMDKPDAEGRGCDPELRALTGAGVRMFIRRIGGREEWRLGSTVVREGRVL